MSLELANEKWLDDSETGLLGQFASTQGYTDLIKASRSRFPKLKRFLELGATEEVSEVQAELQKLIKSVPPDIASTAKALSDLMEGQELVIITNGGS